MLCGQLSWAISLIAGDEFLYRFLNLIPNGLQSGYNFFIYIDTKPEAMYLCEYKFT
jgi:hypothetical protein